MSNEYFKLFEDLMSGDNETRTRADAKFQEIKTINILDGFQIFIKGMKSEKSQVLQLSFLMLEKTNI